jgi:hypothetical protein
MANLLPPISVDLGGLTVPRPGEVPSEAYRRLQGDGSIPPGTSPEVVQMLDDGGDPALSGPAPAFSDTDPTTLRKTPDPADPLSAKAVPETPWWDLSRYAPAAPPPPKIAPWMTKSPQVNPEQRKRDSSRFDPTLIDSLFGSGVGRMSPSEQKVEQDKRKATAAQADLVNRMLKEQERTLRGGNPYDGATFRGTNVPVTTAGDRNVAEKKAKAEGPEATLKQWRDVTERSLQSFLNGLVAVPKGFAIGVDAQRYLLGQILHGNPNITPNAVVETLDRVSNDIRQALPGDPTRNDELISQLGQGGGSMASFLMGGAVAKALGLPAKVGLAINGGYVGGTQAYDEAIAFGADAPTRYLSFLIGTGLGMTEMIPIDRALSRLNIAGEGVVARIVAGAMANSLEEMIQEVGQQIGQNTMARVLYDNSREIFEGVGDAAVVSAILGGMFGGGATAVNAVVQRIGASQKPAGVTPPAGGQSEQGASGTPPTDSATPATGKLNDMAGPLAGTVVEVLEKTDDGSGYMVRTPDGQVTFTGVQTLDADVSQLTAAPLQSQPLNIQGTGPGNRVLNQDLGKAFTDRHLAKYGRALNPDDPADYKTVISSLQEDYAEQSAQPDNGEAWYSDDIATAIDETSKIIPEVKQPVYRDLFLTMAALLSPQQKPLTNWENAVLAMQGYLQDGAIPTRKPNGKQFGVNSHTTGLQLLQHLIKTKGLEGALTWVRTPVTGREMAEIRRDSGLFEKKDKLGGYLPNETNLNETKLGIYMMGPKVGDFMQNSVGIDQNAVTVDLWMARTYNRLIGRLTDVPAGVQEAGGLADQVRGRAERENIKRLVRDAAREAGIAPSAMQAALWYFEQRLYRSHGIRSDSQNFSGAARAAVTKRGADVGAAGGASGAAGQVASPKLSVADTAARFRAALDALNARRAAQGSVGGLWRAREGDVGTGEGLPRLNTFEIADTDAELLAQYGVETAPIVEHPAASYAAVFHSAISESKAASKYGAAVYVYTPEEYAQMRLFTTEDGSAGFAIKADGDIVSVFSQGNVKNIGYTLLQLAVEQGGTKLDAFDTVLPIIYRAVGFAEVGRSPWNEEYKPDDWNYDTFAAFNGGRPDVVFMEYQPALADAQLSDPDVSAIRAPERPRAPYPLERTRPAGGIPAQAAQGEVSPAKTDINTRFKDAIDLVVKQGRFGQGNSKAEAIYKWGQSVARVKSQGQMLELFHEGGHHLHSRLEPILDKAIDKHQGEIFKIADTLYGGGGQLKMSDILARRREGFATFFQVYMNNPAEARVIAPGFLPDFEKLMEENSPGIKSELDAIRKDVDAWLTSKSSAQLARERVVSNKKLGTVGKIVESVKNGTLLHDTATLANRVYQATLNDQHPITLAVRQLRRAAEENIRTQIERGLLNRQQAEAELARLDRRGAADPVKMAALARNSYNASSETIATGVAKYRGDGTAVTKGIPEILQTAMGAGRFRLDPQVYDDFNTYLAMRRIVTEWKNYYATLAWDRAQNYGAAALNPNAPEPAIKRYRRPDDVSLGDAQQAIADLERGNPSFAAGARDLYDYLDALLQYKVDAGIITQEMADMQRQIADYVPLRREMDDTKSGSLGNSKDARTGKDNLVRVFKGSDRRILSPIESVMQMTHETMALVAKNDVKRAMVDIALDIGRGSGAIVEKIPSTAMKGTGVKLSEVIKAAGDFSLAEEVAQAMGRDEITMREFMDEVLDGDEVATIWRKADISEKGEPIIYTWRNGEMEAYTLNDQEWADDLYTALTELGREQTNMAIQILGKPAAFVRAGVTSAPPFLIANIVRDQLASWVLNDGVYPVISLGKGMASDLADRKARRLYNLSMANIGGSNIAALDKTRFGTEQTMLAKAGIGVTTEQGLNTALRLVDSSETWSRQGIWQAAYKKALADGLSPADAMIEAGFEATDYANYGRAGSKMLLARRLITFLNANLQGLDKSLRTALGGEGGAAFMRKELAPWVRRQISPAFAARLGFEGSTTSLPLTPMEKKQLARAGRTMTKMAMLAVPSALLAMLYWDDEEYQEMSPYMKGTRWMIKLEPGKWLAIPKPFQLATFATFVEYAIDSVIGGDATAMQKFIESQAAVVAPPYENPGIKLFYELAANKNLFTDREIVPNYVAARPAWLQYDEYTSEFGKLIGRFTGTSPMVVDHVITSSFATWGRGFLSASNQLNPERQSQGLDDFAFTSYFVKDGSRSSTVRPAFFNLVGQTNGKLKGAYDGYKQLMDAGAEGQADQLLSQLSEDQRAFALLYYHQEVDAKRLHPLRNAYDIVQTISSMRKEIAFNRLREGGKDDGEIITLSPSQQKLLSDRLSDLQVRLQRNALIATGEAGFAQRQILPTLPLVDQIKAIDPRVATDLKARLGSRVYTTDVVAELWPAVKAEILGKGAKANLKPFVLKAKGAGRKIWTGAKP